MKFSAVLLCVLVTTAIAASVDESENKNVGANGEQDHEMTDDEKRIKTGKVILLSMGALRYWIVQSMPKTRKRYPIFARVQEMTPVPPTKGPVNHYTIATGLYAEGHGVIDDCKYDEPNGQCKYGKHYDNIKPIWIENQKEGRISAVMDWPGSDEEYSGEKAKIILTYEKNEDCLKQNEERIKKIFNALDEENANLAMVYYSEIDQMLHEFNTTKDYRQKKFDCADSFIDSLIQKLESEYKNINLILLGTHGGDFSNNNSGKIELKKILDNCPFVAMGGCAIVTPEDDKQREKVYEILKKNAKDSAKYRVYYRNMPEIWHMDKLPLFDNNIYLVANTGYFWNQYLEEGLTTHPSPLGATGFTGIIDGYIENEGDSNPTILMAIGPRFNRGTEVKAFETFKTIHVYALLRELLSLPQKANTEMCDAVDKLLKPIKDVIFKDENWVSQEKVVKEVQKDVDEDVHEVVPKVSKRKQLGKKTLNGLKYVSQPMRSVLLGGFNYVGEAGKELVMVVAETYYVLKTTYPK